jgi:hypothetical protein
MIACISICKENDLTIVSVKEKAVPVIEKVILVKEMQY